MESEQGRVERPFRGLFGAGGRSSCISRGNVRQSADVALGVSTPLGSGGAHGHRFFREIPNEASADGMYLFCGCLLWLVRRTRG